MLMSSGSFKRTVLSEVSSIVVGAGIIGNGFAPKDAAALSVASKAISK